MVSDDLRFLSQDLQLVHYFLVQIARFPEVATAEAEAQHGMPHRPVPPVVDGEPLEQRLVALEQLLAGVEEQALAEAPRARQEVVLSLVEQLPNVSGLVHVVAAPLPDLAEGLHADGQLASSHGHAHGSWSPAYIVVSAGCGPVAGGRTSLVDNRSPAEAPPAAEGSPPCPGQSVSRVTPVNARSSCRASSIRGSEGCAASRVVISTRSRITIIRRAGRFRAPSSGTVRRSRSPWYCIVQAHLVRRLVARLTGPERRQPQHTARLAHVRLTGRCRPLPVEQPAMPRAPKQTRRNRHLRLRLGSARCRITAVQARLVAPCRPPCRGSSALASRSLSA